MDPMLAQGFSSLTKALIGDPETDYQVARTNRVNELLPLEKQQMQAQIGGSNASAAAARALETLRQSQTLTEDQLRNPRVQTELANAKAVLALASERDASAAQTTALTPSMIAENQAQAESSLAQAFKFNADGTQTAALTPSMIAENQAQAESSLAQAFKFNADGTQTAALTPSMIAENQAQAKSSLAQAGNYGASAAQTAALTPSMIAENKAKAESSLAQAGNYGASATQTEALTPSIIAENQAGADEKRAAAALSKAKTDSEGRVILNAGQTIRTTDANGNVQTYTAPKTTEVTVEAGEVAVIVNPDGTQTRIEGPEGAGDPKDGAAFLEGIDSQLNTFFESEAWSKVSPTLSRRIRSAMTAASKGQDLTTAAERIQALMSDTYKGQNVVELQGGWGDGAAFSVPGYVLNFISDAIKNDNVPKASEISKEYGLSLKESKSVLEFLGV